MTARGHSFVFPKELMQFLGLFRLADVTVEVCDSIALLTCDRPLHAFQAASGGIVDPAQLPGQVEALAVALVVLALGEDV